MRLILNGDDLGYSPGVNQAILALHRLGRLTSTSLLVNLPHSAQAMAMLREAPNLGVGIHLNLTRGWPCLPGARIPSLVTADGSFHRTPAFFARAVSGRVELEEVELELRAQIELARTSGVSSITHLDSHSHWHILPALGQLVDRLAIELGIPGVRQRRVRRTLAPSLMWLAARQPVRGRWHPNLAVPDYLLSLHQWIGSAGTASLISAPRLGRLLEREGVAAELVVHPGAAIDPDFPTDTLCADHRAREVAFVQGDDFGAWLAALGAQLVSYQDLE